MKKHTLLMVVVVAMAVAYLHVGSVAADGDNWADRVSIVGYFQARYEGSDMGEDDFDLRRMYITMLIDANERTKGVITWARIGPDPIETSSTDWANIFVEYAVSDMWTVTVGQAPTHLGLECEQSSAARMALERAAMLEGGGSRPFGLYFAGPWDRGLWITRTPQGTEPHLTLGIMNGQFRGGDKNNNKTVSIDAKWNPAWGQFGASYLDGEYTNMLGMTTDRQALLGFLRWDDPDCRWAFQGEYLEGELFGCDINGYYGQAEYSGLNPGGTGFVKYEEFDPDDATAGDTYEALHFGYAQWLDANNEVTVQYTDADMGSSSWDEFGLQWQFGFK